jgi:hypothetical protein
MRACVAILLLPVLCAAVCAQQRPKVSVEGGEQPINQRFSNAITNSAVLITVGGSQSPEEKHGTGFLLYKGGEGSERKACRSVYATEATENTVPCRVLLVTNRHVLPREGDNSPVFIKVANFSETGKRVSEIEIQVFDEVGRYLPEVKFHPGGYDIAAIDVTRDLDRNGLTNFSILGTSILAVRSNPPAGMRALPATLGDLVYILGYPSGIYDPRNAYPILRSGIIATDPHNDFEFNTLLREKYGFPADIKGFLIDAAIFPGSSGSLVLRKPINNEFPYTPYAVGIISDSIPIDDSELKSVQRMGLAVVYSSDAIIETLAQFKWGPEKGR